MKTMRENNVGIDEVLVLNVDWETLDFIYYL